MNLGKYLKLRGVSPCGGDKDFLGKLALIIRDTHGVQDPTKMICSPLFDGDLGIIVEVREFHDCSYRIAFGSEILWVRWLDVCVFFTHDISTINGVNYVKYEE